VSFNSRRDRLVSKLIVYSFLVSLLIVAALLVFVVVRAVRGIF
jgi:hypothetical protein